MIVHLALLVAQAAVSDSSGTASFLASLRAHRTDPVPFVLEALRRHRVVFLGDIHPAAEPKIIVSAVIAAQAAAPTHPALAALALEVGQTNQAVIDRYLATAPEDTTILLDHPVTLRVQWGASREYLDIYRAVWRHNHEGAGRARPIAIIAADAPGWPLPALTPGIAVQAFATRDPWVAEALERALARVGPTGRLLVFFGGYHGLKTVGARITIGAARSLLDGWAAGFLARRGVDVYTILTDGAAPGGGLDSGATHLYPLVTGAVAPPFVAALDSTVDAVAEPLVTIEQPGYRLEFIPYRFSLRQAVDAYLFLGPLRPTTPLVPPSSPVVPRP